MVKTTSSDPLLKYFVYIQNVLSKNLQLPLAIHSGNGILNFRQGLSRALSMNDFTVTRDQRTPASTQACSCSSQCGLT